MRRGSILAIKNEKDVVSGAKTGREANMAKLLSYQFMNLARGTSFISGQLKKWAKEMNDEDIMLVELVAFEEMQRLLDMSRIWSRPRKIALILWMSFVETMLPRIED